MTKLPPCDCRIATDERKVFLCRHPRVHARGNRVESVICARCTLAACPCPEPRIISPDAAPEERQPPPLYVQAWNLASALAAFAADGFRTVTKEQYQQRLAICDTCPERRGTQCLKCGCRLPWKATGRAFQCPLDKWPTIPDAPNADSPRPLDG